ncbi:MAG: hypothetical protein QMB62_12360 [Oscillospiraceae bacterium]
MKRKRYCRTVTMIITCIILVSLAGAYALADAIWEPNDDFYRAHFDDCTYVNRQYYSNGETGYMEFFTAPGGTSLGFADNGKLFNVQFSYKLGDEVWGVATYSKDGEKLVPVSDGDEKCGWFKLSDAELKYDYQSFDEAHNTEYKPYEGDRSEFKDVQSVVVWTFPNSGESNGTLDKVDENFEVQSVYTDIDGVQWGFVNYYYGMKNFWVCLSNPTDASIAAKDVPVPEFHTPSPDSKPTQSGNDLTTVIVICVAAAILCTAVLFAALNRKKRDKAEKK